MKRQNSKRGKLLLGVLVGIVALGIGYAALTNVQLSITGTAKAKGSATQEDFRVRFVNSEDASSTYTDVATAAANHVVVNTTESTNATATASLTDDTNATFSVDGMEEGDAVVIKYYVANLSTDLNATITNLNVVNNNDSLFNVTATLTDNKLLLPGMVQEVVVRVECIAQNKLDTTGNFSVSYTAVPTEPAN